MDQRINAGYIITNSVQIGSCEFVLGVNQRSDNNYVTWKCADGNDYYWGHYFSDLFQAQKNLAERASVNARSEAEAKELAQEQYYAGNVFWKDTEEEITDVVRERERGDSR